jgi:hypothetical protein
MGLDYGYEWVGERGSADRLIRAVAEHLAPKDQRRVLAALASGADGLLRRVEREEFERSLMQDAGEELCLSFLFGRDDRLAEYAREISAPSIGDRVQVGCVWTSTNCGSRFVLIRARAATSNMSRLFEQSPSIRATFVGAGRAADALLVMFDDEQEEFLALWPRAGRFAARDWALVDQVDDLSVDDYCAELIASACAKLKHDGQDELRP